MLASIKLRRARDWRSQGDDQRGRNQPREPEDPHPPGDHRRDRYFPDLVSLLNDTLEGLWPSPAVALEPVAGSDDPVERVSFACEFLLRGVLAYQGSIRAMISGTITRPELAGIRPGIRFGLIDYALAPFENAAKAPDPEAFPQLKRDLAVVVSAEALFVLTDLCGLSPDEAVASAVRTAATLTAAAF